MVVGKCALCEKTRELCDSHLLPAGFYRITGEGETPNKHPVRVNKTAAVYSSDQARAHILCSECEDRFNREGEDWVLKNCWRSPTNFPLHSALAAVDALFDDRGFRAYEGKKVSGVDIDKLTYFGASIFWRASVFPSHFGKVEEQRLSLGPYQNALRLYLLGKTGIPDGVVLLVTLSKALSDIYNRVVMMPYLFRKLEYRHYRFVVPGLRFEMLFGKMIPGSLQGGCSARRGCLYMSEDGDAGMLNTMEIMVKTAKSKGKLAGEAAAC